MSTKFKLKWPILGLQKMMTSFQKKKGFEKVNWKDHEEEGIIRWYIQYFCCQQDSFKGEWIDF